MSQRKGNSGPETAFSVSADSAAVQIAANTSDEVQFAVPGAEVGDVVVASIPAGVVDGLTPGQCRVSGANIVQMRIGNSTAGALPGVAAVITAQFVVMKPNAIGNIGA